MAFGDRPRKRNRNKKNRSTSQTAGNLVASKLLKRGSAEKLKDVDCSESCASNSLENEEEGFVNNSESNPDTEFDENTIPVIKRSRRLSHVSNRETEEVNADTVKKSGRLGVNMEIGQSHISVANLDSVPNSPNDLDYLKKKKTGKRKLKRSAQVDSDEEQEPVFKVQGNNIQPQKDQRMTDSCITGGVEIWHSNSSSFRPGSAMYVRGKVVTDANLSASSVGANVANTANFNASIAKSHLCRSFHESGTFKYDLSDRDRTIKMIAQDLKTSAEKFEREQRQKRWKTHSSAVPMVGGSAHADRTVSADSQPALAEVRHILMVRHAPSSALHFAQPSTVANFMSDESVSHLPNGKEIPMSGYNYTRTPHSVQSRQSFQCAANRSSTPSLPAYMSVRHQETPTQHLPPSRNAVYGQSIEPENNKCKVSSTNCDLFRKNMQTPFNVVHDTHMVPTAPAYIALPPNAAARERHFDSSTRRVSEGFEKQHSDIIAAPTVSRKHREDKTESNTQNIQGNAVISSAVHLNSKASELSSVESRVRRILYLATLQQQNLATTNNPHTQVQCSGPASLPKHSDIASKKNACSASRVRPEVRSKTTAKQYSSLKPLKREICDQEVPSKSGRDSLLRALLDERSNKKPPSVSRTASRSQSTSSVEKTPSCRSTSTAPGAVIVESINANEMSGRAVMTSENSSQVNFNQVPTRPNGFSDYSTLRQSSYHQATVNVPHQMSKQANHRQATVDELSHRTLGQAAHRQATANELPYSTVRHYQIAMRVNESTHSVFGHANYNQTAMGSSEISQPMLGQASSVPQCRRFVASRNEQVNFFRSHFTPILAVCRLPFL